MRLRSIALTALLVASCTEVRQDALPDVTGTPPARSGSPAPAATGPGRVDGALAKAHVEWLADPARGGRMTGSAGYAAAAAYVADRFRDAGLEPLGDGGGYLQKFTMPFTDLAATPVLARTDVQPRQLSHRTDFTESVGGRAGGGDVSGPLVFVGAAQRSATVDDFAGLPMSGAVALVAAGAPGVDPLRNAMVAGARAVIVIGGTGDLIKFSYIPRFESETLPVVIATESAIDALLAPTGRRAADLKRASAERVQSNGAPVGFAAGFNVRVAVPLLPVREVEAFNVVGVLRGSSAESAKRAIVVGGHLDGVGTDPSGAVFRAANDNASGPAITLELARVLALDRGALQRSVIFTAFAAEEQGLVGSQAFLQKMAATAWPPASHAAFVNLDVSGCCGDRLSATDGDRDLVDRVRAAAEAEGVPFTTSGGGGSDHASFARQRIPATMVAWSNPGPLHTFADVPAIVEPAKLADAGRVVLRLIRGLAALP